MISTDHDELDRLYPLPPHELSRQWILTRDAARVPEDWRTRRTGDWILGHHADADVRDLELERTGRIGWILEPLIHLPQPNVTPRGSGFTFRLDRSAAGPALERILFGRDRRGAWEGGGFEGSWVAIIVGHDAVELPPRVYLGPTHSVVYAPHRKEVAATPNPIGEFRRDRELSSAFDPLATRRYYTFGLTPFHGVRRLLPNHYLDLRTFRPVRHWPIATLPSRLPDGRRGAREIVNHGRRIIRELSTRYRSFQIYLSAGRDSRAVLALLRPFVGEDELDILLSTTVGPDLESKVDAQAAARLARIAGLPHKVQQRQGFRPDSKRAMRSFARIGEASATKRLADPGVEVRQPETPRFILAGMAGELGRAEFWGRRPVEGRVTAELIARRIGSPLIEPVLEAADSWLQGLPEAVISSPADTLDMAYLEQRMGCWEAPGRYLYPGRPRVASPMASAYAIEVMLGLPEPYRREGGLQRDMVAEGWPDLLSVPFNQPQGVLRLRRAVRPLLRLPARVAHRVQRLVKAP